MDNIFDPVNKKWTNTVFDPIKNSPAREIVNEGLKRTPVTGYVYALGQ